MIHSTTDIDNPVTEEVIVFVKSEPAKTNHDINFTAIFLLQCLRNMFNLPGIPGGLVASLGHLFGEEGVIMPGSALSFIITVLIAFAEIKSQGNSEFPFQTHPHFIMVSVTSLLMYGLASATELLISAAGLDAISAYAIIARLGRIGSLWILVASLACLFYF